MALLVNLAQALTPFAVGLIFTWTKSYRPSLLLLCALALGATWLLRTENRGRETINPDGRATTDLKNG